MQVTTITSEQWDAFIVSQLYAPFLQSSSMSNVYEQTRQHTHKFAIINDAEHILAVCLAVTVRAKRGNHISVPYGPIISTMLDVNETKQVMELCVSQLKTICKSAQCSFIRMSPFWLKASENYTILHNIDQKAVPAPLHLLAETIWYLPLVEGNDWAKSGTPVSSETLFMNLRKTTRNLVRRAEKDGVTIQRSENPVADLPLFMQLHEETRKRHKFTPYTDEFFTAQVKNMAKDNLCSLYLAYFEGECISASIHVHFGKETSYHHGASSAAHAKIPASYLLQWQAITDALERGDTVYNFWGIAPVFLEDNKWHIQQKDHPFAGVTTFKTGFSGNVLELQHCIDIPLNWKYRFTRVFEQLRKWKRGF